MTRSSISIFLLAVGLLWGLIVLGFAALLAGFFGNAPPWIFVVIGKLLLWFSWLLVGPILLIAGTILMLMGTSQRVGSILSLVGCLILTAMVGYQSLLTLHDLADPLIARPHLGEYLIYVVVVVLTFLADAGAAQLYRLAFIAFVR
jgi:hypothetical protein